MELPHTGRSWADAAVLLKAEYPGQAAMIAACHQRWPGMLAYQTWT